MENDQENIFKDAEVISVYTSEQASEDGILFDFSKNEVLSNKFFNFATTNLLYEMGILKYSAKHKTDVVNISMMLDLIEQAKRIVLRNLEETLNGEEHFYCGDVRKLNGERIKIFIEMNETEKFTLLLPQDH